MNDSINGITVTNLRAAADLIERNPDLPSPCVWVYNDGTTIVQWQLMNSDDAKDDQRAVTLAIRKAVGGTWKKSGSDTTFDLRCTLDGLDLQILADREQVCERIVTGTETVTIPAVAATPERTEERVVVEWRCEPLLTEAASA